jgi:superfamily I DNA and/or RNA helicase
VVKACRHFEQELRKRDEKITASILCFYRSQSREIRRRLGAPLFHEFRMLKFEVIDAIDKIQGQESDLVFLSFCRACVERPPGPRFGQWLQDLRRLNVACTRAHRALVFVGHKKTLSSLSSTPEAKAFYSNLFSLLGEHPAMSIISDYR